MAPQRRPTARPVLFSVTLWPHRPEKKPSAFGHRHFCTLILTLLLASHTISALDLEACPALALGMESQRIADAQISASSSFDKQSVGPQNARVRLEINSGAWCPKSQIKNTSYEFLQLSFNRTFVLRAVETQGRYGNGTGREFAQQYMLDYWRQGNSKWIRYRMRNGTELIDGNNDTVTAAFRQLDPPIVAQKVRFVPFSLETRTTCMRVEVYGCEYRDGLVGYSVQPDPTDFSDETFEQTGAVDEETGQKKGLGLLTDGIVPSHGPFDRHFHQPVRNSTWLGFKKAAAHAPLQLHFEFEAERRFSDVELFGFGRPIDNVRVEFAAAPGLYADPVSSQYPPAMAADPLAAQPYSIRIPLNAHKARFVRVTLDSSSEWVFLSEVRFNTDLRNETTSILEDFTLSAGDQPRIYYVFIAVMSVVLFVMVLALCGLLLFRNSKKHGSMDKLSSLGSPTSRSTAATSLSRDLKTPGTLITTLPMNGGQPRHVIHSHSFAPAQGLYGTAKGNLYGDHRGAASSQRILGLAPPSRSCSGTLFKDLAPHHQPSLLDIHFPPPPPSDASTARCPEPALSNSSSEGIYAEPCASIPLLGSARRSAAQRKPLPKPRVAGSACGSLNWKNRTLPVRVRQEEEEQHYAVANFSVASDLPPAAHRLRAYTPAPNKCRQLRRANVQLVEKIGEGRYTQVFSCLLKEAEGEPRRAALKMVRVEAAEARQALLAEAHLAADLDHAHLQRLLGQTEDLGLVGVLAEHGDLRAWMQAQDAPPPPARLVHFCAQMAAGMAHLEQRGIVHGHLSPKSCLLGADLTLRVASARGPNHHAQLRYSAPEAIILNNWSNRSDTYSFGMTAWEVLHGCKQPPYHDLSNQALFENARNQLESSLNSIYPQFDESLSLDAQVADLVKECWATLPEMRPGFHETHVFFARKQLQQS